MKTLFVGLILMFSINTFANSEKSELEKKLDSLNIPSDKVTPVVSEDKIYAVNSRYSSLNRRLEATLFGGNNFTSESHLESTNSGLSLRYHINGKWSVGTRYTEYFNKLSSSGEQLFDDEKILPDSDFAIKSADAFINYNTIYGKVRLTQETIVYFDQYISLGYGHIDLARGEAVLYNLDLGFSFWFGKHMSTRIGVKNEFYEQKKLTGKDNTHNAQGYLEFGYLFGEGRHI